MRGHILMRGLTHATSVGRRSEDRTIWGTTDTFTPKKSRSNVRSAARGSANQGLWPCTRSCTWRNRRTNAPFAWEALTRGPTWRPTCWHTLTTSHTSATSVTRSSGATAISADTSWPTACATCLHCSLQHLPSRQRRRRPLLLRLHPPDKCWILRLVPRRGWTRLEKRVPTIPTSTSRPWETTASSPSCQDSLPAHRPPSTARSLPYRTTSDKTRRDSSNSSNSNDNNSSVSNNNNKGMCSPAVLPLMKSCVGDLTIKGPIYSTNRSQEVVKLCFLYDDDNTKNMETWMQTNKQIKEPRNFADGCSELWLSLYR